MTSFIIPSARSQRRRDVHRRQASFSAPVPASEPVAPSNPHHRGGAVVFEISFTSAMNSVNLELLRRQLDMTTHVEHKLPVDPNSPAVARLDHDSGLFLEHGPGEGRWILQARTWGTPSARTVHEWQVRTAQVVRQLDPDTTPPERFPVTPSDAALRPVGRAANTRLAAVRRRLAGIA